jgi:hypothetical protein
MAIVEGNGTPKLPEGKITDEAVAELKKMIGIELRTERYIQDSSIGTMINFVNGIGDMNPLFRSADYAQWTRFGTMISHPCFPYARNYPGRTRFGLPGVHGFYAGTDWEFYGTYRPGDLINCREKVIDIEDKGSEFSKRLVVTKTLTTYLNQRDDVIAKAVGWSTRHERQTSRESAKYKDVPKKHEYTNDELDEIQRMVLAEEENIRGQQTRHWEDVKAGEEITPIVRGPLSMMDLTAFLIGTGRGRSHGILLKESLKHPAHFFRNPEAAGGVEYTGMGHARESVAQQVGAPGTYDYGPQRISWMASLLTNWAGDNGFLRRLRGELRRFNIVGDTTWLKGKVVDKYVQDGAYLVDCEVWGENQRGEVTMPGFATVELPSKKVDLSRELRYIKNN